jgi:hypothetical protein
MILHLLAEYGQTTAHTTRASQQDLVKVKEWLAFCGAACNPSRVAAKNRHLPDA